MKNICSILILLAIAGSVEAKNMHKVFGTDERTIKNSPKIELYMIDPIPVLSVEQIFGENYIFDYRVMKSVVLKKKDGLAVTKAILDTNQYIYGNAKKCPFMGKYAVRFQVGKRSVTIILSAEPCEKAIIFCPGSIIDKKHIDLIEKSNIFPTINALVNPESKAQNKM